MNAPNILFHPQIPLFEAGRIARDHGCVLVGKPDRLRMVPATRRNIARLERALGLIDRALERIEARDFAAALESVRQVKGELA